jgi:hypothetical protein
MPLPSRMPSKKAMNKMGQYDLIQKFPGYRAREDVTTLPQGTLIAPSQNVVIKTSGRVSLVKGYTLDGTGSTVIDSGILSNYDFTNFKGDVRNLRAGFMTSALNDGKLQYRYLDATVTVNWVDLKTGLTNVRLSYTSWWDTTALVTKVLWVDGSNNVFSWNGAVTTLASATATTVTKQDSTKTWAQEGFSVGSGSIVIGGVSATYSGGETTQTLTGVSVDFSASAVGSIAHQLPVTTALSAMTGILATYAPTVVGTGQKGQLYLGSKNFSNAYISKVNDYTNYSFTTPIRVAGEGFLLQLDAPATKFIPQEDKTTSTGTDMYISQGLNAWSVVEMTVSSDLTKESIANRRLKVSPLLGAMSERLCTKMKNEIIFVANDKVANFLGYQSYQYVPAITDFSYPIIDDQNSYDFTDASIFYHKNYIYEAIPKAGLVRIFNMTDQTKQYSSYNRVEEDITQQPWFWEAPVTYPVSGFYVTPDKGLCMHSYTTSESYQAFTGGSFNGQDITAVAQFSYDDKGDRTQSKGSNELWIEGRIKQNTKLNANITGDIDAFANTQTVVVDGSNSNYVAFGAGAHSLGTTDLGSKSLGGFDTSLNALSAYFHVSKTYVQVPFYLESISFNTKGVDLDWELITFGTSSEETPEGNNSISD